MLEELHTASNLLCTALERYARACSALRDSCSYNSSINSTTEISDNVTNELDLIESYKDKLARAHVAVKGARNGLASVPINSLPAEVLTNIFHLVVSEQACLLKVLAWSSKPARLPKYPDTLSHVCSRWRRIALASPGLWSHIDIVLSCPLSKGFHHRAEVYLSRAQQLPLDIHFADVSGVSKSEILAESNNDTEEDLARRWDDFLYGNNPKQFTFLSSSTPCRIRSLRLLVHYTYHPIHSRALEYCLASCTSGGLSELTIDVFTQSIFTPIFLEPDPDWQQPTSPGIRLLLSEQQLENEWRSITRLDVRGIYPRWSSAAYHGLTDLRLGGETYISKLDLVGVLRSSPRLRTISCSLNIDDEPQPNADLTPAFLPELEVLEISAMQGPDAQRFLPLLNPGPKPLRFSFCGNPTAATLGDFFARSNVQHLRLSPRRHHPELAPEMFYLPSQLQVLRLDRWGSWDQYLGQETTPPTRSDTVYMLNCNFSDPVRFRNTVAKLSPQRLVLWECSIGDSRRRMDNVDLAYLESTVGSDIFQLCPSIECPTSQDPYPLRGLHWL